LENCHICCPTSKYTIWHRYLQILESFGPFGDECWLTVHVSMWWLLDLFFLSPLSISNSTGKFRRKWRLMVKMRCIYVASMMLSSHSYICYTSYSYIYFLDSAPLICSPPVLLVFPPAPHHRKRKRRWNLFRKYFRPSDTARIEKQSRSYNSSRLRSQINWSIIVLDP
jgi:hypothetical protein